MFTMNSYSIRVFCRLGAKGGLRNVGILSGGLIVGGVYLSPSCSCSESKPIGVDVILAEMFAESTFKIESVNFITYVGAGKRRC